MPPLKFPPAALSGCPVQALNHINHPPSTAQEDAQWRGGGQGVLRARRQGEERAAAKGVQHLGHHEGKSWVGLGGWAEGWVDQQAELLASLQYSAGAPFHPRARGSIGGANASPAHAPLGSACTVGRCPLCPRTPLLRAGGADQPGHGPGGGRLWLP